MQWRVVKCFKVSWCLLSAVHTKQEPVIRMEPGETECIAATHERAGRHPLHVCCDVNCIAAFKWPMCELADDYVQHRANHSLPCNSSPHSDDPTHDVFGAAPELGGGGAREAGDPGEDPPTKGIVRHDSHFENPVTRPGIEPGSPWREARVLIIQPPRPLKLYRVKRYEKTTRCFVFVVRMAQTGESETWELYRFRMQARLPLPSPRPLSPPLDRHRYPYPFPGGVSILVAPAARTKTPCCVGFWHGRRANGIVPTPVSHCRDREHKRRSACCMTRHGTCAGRPGACRVSQGNYTNNTDTNIKHTTDTSQDDKNRRPLCLRRGWRAWYSIKARPIETRLSHFRLRKVTSISADLTAPLRSDTQVMKHGLLYVPIVIADKVKVGTLLDSEATCSQISQTFCNCLLRNLHKGVLKKETIGFSLANEGVIVLQYCPVAISAKPFQFQNGLVKNLTENKDSKLTELRNK
ncbi:hypothetical protein PR048_022821 [Dryococelus australis]|uniref:Uncharacterized protein n=1 Tax=Dryococelus australis TaxID=614101 RepID=A0ABQ9GSB3_9NEOP|nr:hypothetical protein PR048_022821 [Dryococelus australis]